MIIEHNAFFRIVGLKNINDLSVGNQITRLNDQETSSLVYDLAQAGLNKLQREEQVLAVMEWVMNQCNKSEVYFGKPYDALVHARAGGGLSCGPLAGIFKESLRALNLHAREVWLVRSLMNPYDTHATVEVYIDDKWQIYDPTFNVSYRAKGASSLLGAQEINDMFISGKFTEIEPIFYGEVAYPARLENYYMHFLPLYNNIFILHDESNSIVRRLPPFRFFYGPKLFYKSPADPNSPLFIVMHREIYFLFILVLPLVNLLFMCALIVLTVKQNTGRKGIGSFSP